MKARRMLIASVLTIGVALSAQTASAATQTYWQGGDGDWHDPSKWSAGVPTADMEVYFKSWSGGDYSVTNNGTAVFGTMVVQWPTEGEPNSKVRFCGTGTITSHATGGSYTRRPIEIDGPTVTLDGVLLNCDDVILTSGALLMEPTASAVWNPTVKTTDGYKPTIYVKGGVLKCAKLVLKDIPSCAYVQTDGDALVMTMTTDATLGDRQFAVSGGIFRRPVDFVLKAPATSDYGAAKVVVNGLTFNNQNAAANELTVYADSFVIKDWMTETYSNPTVHFPHGITFRSLGDWYNYQLANLNIAETFRLDTCDFADGETSHNVRFDAAFRLLNRVSFEVSGGGVVSAVNDGIGILPRGFDALRLKDGSSLDARSSGNAARARRFLPEQLELSAGSELKLRAGFDRLDASGASSVAEGAKLVVQVDAGALTAGNTYPILGAGPTGSVASLDVSLLGEGAAGWSAVKSNNAVYLSDGTELVPDPGNANQWSGLGSTDDLSEPDNWSAGTAGTLYNKHVVVYSRRGTMNIDYDDAVLYRFQLYPGSGPLRVTGKPITLVSQTVYGSYSAVCITQMKHPLVFENLVRQYASNDITDAYAADSLTDAYIAFMGGLDIPNRLGVNGHVIVGSAATIGSVYLYGNGMRTSRLEVSEGAVVNVTRQRDVFAQTGSYLRVNAGGRLTFASDGSFVASVAQEHDINGILDIACPFLPSAGQSFYGTGRVVLANPSAERASVDVTIGERLTFVPGTWPTVVATAPANVLRLKLKSHATIGAASDWTYGPAADAVPTTEASARSLVVPAHETLTVDTENAETHIGHVVTFADPIEAADAKVVKTGTGRMVLASSANDFSTTDFRLEGGELSWTQPQTFGAFSATEGTKLVFGAKDGAVLPLSVVGSAILKDVTVDLSASARECAAAWTTVLSVPTEQTANISLSAADGVRLRAVTFDGVTEYQARTRAGMVLIVR